MKSVYSERSLLGDCLFLEPALRAYAQKHKQKVKFALDGLPLDCAAAVSQPDLSRFFFEGHPDIELLPIGTSTEDMLQVDISRAFHWSVQHNAHLCQGFFHQLGMDPSLYNDKRPMIGPEEFRRPVKKEAENYIVIAPFSHSCTGNDPKINPPGTRPERIKRNKTISLDWWDELIHELTEETGLSIHSFGAKKEPVVAGTVSHRGEPLKVACRYIKDCRLYIGVDTGLTAIAGAVDADIVLLSAASPVWLCGPQTAGKLEVVSSVVPPSWTISETVTAVKRILKPPFDPSKMKIGI